MKIKSIAIPSMNVKFKLTEEIDIDDDLVNSVSPRTLELYLICRMLHLEEMKTIEEK